MVAKDVVHRAAARRIRRAEFALKDSRKLAGRVPGEPDVIGVLLPKGLVEPIVFVQVGYDLGREGFFSVEWPSWNGMGQRERHDGNEK